MRGRGECKECKKNGDQAWESSGVKPGLSCPVKCSMVAVLQNPSIQEEPLLRIALGRKQVHKGPPVSILLLSESFWD